jgi:peptide deformylase
VKYRNIYIFGEPVLREKARPVEKFDKNLKSLVERMLKVMKEADGVGLAAPQIGVSLRVVTIDVGEGPYVLVNPEIIWYSEEESDFEEGCLSFPGVSVNIRRPEKVRVSYFDEKGGRAVIEADGLFARAVQHELDHLNGVLIIDRASPEERMRLLEDFEKNLSVIRRAQETSAG